MTDLVARRGAESRRHGRATRIASDSAQRAGFGFGGQIGRGGAPIATPGATPGTAPGWRSQAPTEFELGRLLTELDDGFTVLRAYDVFGELDADFVVIGPAGVFLITTRSRSGATISVDEDTLWVDGQPTNQVRAARQAADRASARLSTVMGQTVRVTPVIAVMDPTSLSFGGDPAQRVVTLPADLVARWLSECSRTLSDGAVVYTAMVAEDRATWGSLSNDSGLLARVR